LEFTKEKDGNNHLALKDGVSEDVLYGVDTIGFIPARFWKYHVDLAGDVFSLGST
jgi:hypothetical protein